jgi:CubicO group peptidase (beta-lactamase class C family)
MMEVEADPGELGFTPSRLDRIAEYFHGYVEDGRLPGWLVVVARHGKVAYLVTEGLREIEANAPVEPDTIWRIYSMTKPITSLAVMTLYEQGLCDIRDPVEEYLPTFAKGRVLLKGGVTEPAKEPVRIWHLLTHTSGMSSTLGQDPVAKAYREVPTNPSQPRPLDLGRLVDHWGAQPLLFHPGTAWRYASGTDVLGRLVEVLSGMPLDRYYHDHIFEPLGMTDTFFAVPEDRLDRLAALYETDRTTRRAVLRTPGGASTGQQNSQEPRPGAALAYLSGSHGLYSSAADYHRFCQRVLNGGELDGARVLSSKTLQFMLVNQLPSGKSLPDLDFGGGISDHMTFDGLGFGLGFSVVLDPAHTKIVGSRGTVAWSGTASTAFFIDLQEQLSMMFFTQLVPSQTWPLRARLQQLVYQAIADRA